MLHWLAGKPHDAAVLDATAYLEPPETPAPVFAVRAFKHAIFGTPATVQRHPRRHSEDETGRKRHNARPGMMRPKSANETTTMHTYESVIEDEPLPSPTKGILLTPGTATTRRKTVSFGDGVVDNEGKRPMKGTSTSGLPDDCPGKFPSPWSNSVLEPNTAQERLRTHSKLNERLEQVRDESAQKKARLHKAARVKHQSDANRGLPEPLSEGENYWKNLHEAYSAKTIEEARKMIERIRSSREYARAKDDENVGLRTELREQRNNVERLESRIKELEMQLEEYRLQLASMNMPKYRRKDSSDRPKNISALLSEKRGAEASEPLDSPPAEGDLLQRPERLSWKTSLAQKSRERAQCLTNHAQDKSHEGDTGATRPKSDRAKRKARSRPRDIETKVQDDIWAPSSLVPPQVEPSPPSPSGSRAVTSGTDATPLQSLSINALPNDESRALAMSMGLQPPSPQREKRQDSPMRSPVLPQPSPELPAKVSSTSQEEPAKPSVNAELSMVSTQVPESSLFEPDAVSERPNILTGESVPIRAAIRSPPKLQEVKEEMLPPLRTGRPRNTENQKPTAAWTNLDNPKRIDSKELSADKYAAARERLLAKGRNVS